MAEEVLIPIKQAGQTAVELNVLNPIGVERQLVFETDTLRAKLLDGVSAYNDLPYIFESAAIVWGGIGGTLSDQTDLQNALNAKLDVSTAASTYLTIANAASTYLTISNAASTYLTQANAASTYLTQANAASTYATIASLSNYLTTATAASTYLTIANAASTYLTQANASSTYATIASLSSYLTTASAASTYVPYTGATGAVNLGANNLNTTGAMAIGEAIVSGIKLAIQATNATDVGLRIKGVSSQSGDYINAQTSTAVNRFKITSTGGVVLGDNVAAGEGNYMLFTRLGAYGYAITSHWNTSTESWGLDYDGLRVGASIMILNSANGTGKFRLRGTMIAFDAFTSASAGIKRSGTELQVRLADDSAFAPLQAAGATFNGTVYSQAFGFTTPATRTIIYPRGADNRDVGFRLGHNNSGTASFRFNDWDTDALLFKIQANGLVSFMGETSSFPALKRSSTELQVRLADDSGFAPLQASQFFSNDGYLGYGKIVVSNGTSGSPTVLTSSDSGKHYVNTGASAETYINLPTAVAGLRFRFTTNTNQRIRVVAATGDIIRYSDSSASTSGGYAQSTNAAAGLSIEIEAVDSTYWQVVGVTLGGGLPFYTFA